MSIRFSRAGAAAAAFLLSALLITAAPARAQLSAPTVFYACYVPLTGTIYRIKETGLRAKCASSAHVEFHWTDAATDQPRYLLANGVRNSTDGFAVTGTFRSGAIPVEGPGARLMWYPGKAAFRVGLVQNPADVDFWDDANVGDVSIAMGINTKASGSFSVAIGGGALARGLSSMALGTNVTADGRWSTAMGFGTLASADGATAMGQSTVASGQNSTAMGFWADTDEHEGAFVYGDRTAVAKVKATADNQFVVRASGGTILYSNAGLTAGVSLAPGAGAWATVSDRNRKRDFREVDGDRILRTVADLPIQSWGYLSQDASIRHLGPTAQDFYAAFGLGESRLTITTTDIDGVALVAIQALERRTRDLQRENEALLSEMEALRESTRELEGLASRLIGLEARYAGAATVRRDRK